MLLSLVGQVYFWNVIGIGYVFVELVALFVGHLLSTWFLAKGRLNAQCSMNEWHGLVALASRFASWSRFSERQTRSVGETWGEIAQWTLAKDLTFRCKDKYWVLLCTNSVRGWKCFILRAWCFVLYIVFLHANRFGWSGLPWMTVLSVWSFHFK